jgi:hypothetical protein
MFEPMDLDSGVDNLQPAQVLQSPSGADTRLPSVIETEAHPQSILYVTSEMSDFVKAGGLGEVSAALPRALQNLYDVRVLIPGYREVLKATGPLPVVGRLKAAFGLPAADIGRLVTKDGLTIYVLLCPQLYDREGTPTATPTASTGSTTTSASRASRSPPRTSPAARAIRSGSRTSCTSTIGPRASPPPI